MKKVNFHHCLSWGCQSSRFTQRDFYSNILLLDNTRSKMIKSERRLDILRFIYHAYGKNILFYGEWR